VLSRILRSLLRPGGAASLEQGSAALAAGDWAGAEQHFRRVLSGGKDTAAAFHGLGVALWQQKRLDEGLEALQLAVDRAPRDLDYRLWLAAALEKTAPMEAVSHLRAARELAPQAPEIDARFHKPLMEACAWQPLQAELDRLLHHARTEPAERWTRRVDAFVALGLPLSRELRAEAVRGRSLRVAAGVQPMKRPPRRTGAKPRVGYVASDEFGNHAVAHLVAGVLERHDLDSFEYFAYAYAADDGSDYRRRMRGGFHHWIDVASMDDAQAAGRIAADGIDILVNLKGYTAGARPGIFALRPAPAQVSWVAYPGSMQADFMDYLIADATVVPPEDFPHVREKAVWMPASYMPTDDRQPVATDAGGRRAHGLAEDAFVYCCFNRTYKIERELFAAWMRILHAVPKSVLWLLAGNADTEGHLRGAAAAGGIDPTRLLFAPRQKKPEHLARHRLADLFLDTHTYNAHTTGGDALWAGLPLLTWPGESFAGRVAASLLRAVDLPELIAPTLADYERIAIELSTDRQRLGNLRARLAQNRLRMPLFRTADYARDLQAAYRTMLPS
jgi:predicted O-linked N-acetylglucosamine transferase (SPINDLY family)